MHCDVFPKLNLHLWKTDSPALQVPEAILIQTLEKGTQSLAQRRKEEYELWEHSKKYILHFVTFSKKIFYQLLLSDYKFGHIKPNIICM